ncbi:MAG: DUF1616 domain-containing protein [Thermoplasmata archaeon]
MTRIYDAKLLMLATVLSGTYTIVELLVGGVPQLLLGLFVVLVAPGYAVAALLFGRASRLPWTVHFALIVGLTVVIEASVGTLYYFGTPGGQPLNNVLGVMATALCLVATLVQTTRGEVQDLSPISEKFRRWTALPGFSSGQRVAAYSALTAILVIFGAIGVLSTVHPNGGPLLSIAVVGPDGTTTTLPTGGRTNQTLQVIVEVGNDGTPQSLNLTVSSALVGGAGGSSSIPWTMPLHLDSGTQSSVTVTLAGGASTMIPISFEFANPGGYSVTFTLQAPSGTSPAVAGLGLTIT